MIDSSDSVPIISSFDFSDLKDNKIRLISGRFIVLIGFFDEEEDYEIREFFYDKGFVGLTKIIARIYENDNGSEFGNVNVVIVEFSSVRECEQACEMLCKNSKPILGVCFNYLKDRHFVVLIESFDKKKGENELKKFLYDMGFFGLAEVIAENICENNGSE
jgi:hypothetical protein